MSWKSPGDKVSSCSLTACIWFAASPRSPLAICWAARCKGLACRRIAAICERPLAMFSESRSPASSSCCDLFELPGCFLESDVALLEIFNHLLDLFGDQRILSGLGLLQQLERILKTRALGVGQPEGRRRLKSQPVVVQRKRNEIQRYEQKQKTAGEIGCARECAVGKIESRRSSPAAFAV